MFRFCFAVQIWPTLFERAPGWLLTFHQSRPLWVCGQQSHWMHTHPWRGQGVGRAGIGISRWCQSKTEDRSARRLACGFYGPPCFKAKEVIATKYSVVPHQYHHFHHLTDSLPLSPCRPITLLPYQRISISC